MKLRIRARAREDLDTIYDYSAAEYGVARADAYLRAIEEALTSLTKYPALGMARPDLKAALRSYPVGEHRIYYLLLDDRISVIRVLHKAMDIERHL